ncbi:DUF6069 family protein [Luteimicrobium sp. NPDC057192]|uniref:DUF6069 family protein n=1 Tax=Luteimicrobium sp. NPDC057192 TaxID=3346042 RepID=UPI003630A1D6
MSTKRTNTLTGRQTTGTAGATSGRTTPAVGARLAWLTTGTAAAAALLLWTLVVPVGGLDLRAGGAGTGSGGDAPTVGPVNVLFIAVVAGMAAWAVAAWLRRRGGSRRAWFGVATAVLAASLAGPVSASTLASGVVLVAMHVVVGGILALGYARAWRS